MVARDDQRAVRFQVPRERGDCFRLRRVPRFVRDDKVEGFSVLLGGARVRRRRGARHHDDGYVCELTSHRKSQAVRRGVPYRAL